MCAHDDDGRVRGTGLGAGRGEGVLDGLHMATMLVLT